jgi:REP element-mobilizing transposase RayT
VLPEHLHCVIELPVDDDDFATRWRLIKMDFSKSLADSGQAGPPFRPKPGHGSDEAGPVGVKRVFHCG